MLRKSPLKRKTKLTSRGKVKRSPMRGKKSVRKRGGGDRWRSEIYLAWVRSLRCSVCGASGGVAAHHITAMYNLSGMGLKAPDSFVMPACDPAAGGFNDCHRRIHAEKALRDRQPKYLRHTIALGMQEFDGEIHEALSEALEFINARDMLY